MTRSICDLPFTDWKRDPGKSGRKDTYHDFEGGRLVRKVRTGMVFLQSDASLIACGPCLKNDNQVINFVNAQLMNRLQRGGALICHAAGVVIGGKCLTIAGFSGGGKSSLMLRLMGLEGSAYLSNDRLFLEAGSDGGVEAVGIPKLPRVNPGTITSLQPLRPILGEERCRKFESMPGEELWNLEEKYDIDITSIYGAQTIVPRAPLGAVLILNWNRMADTPFKLSKVDLDQRRDLLPALMKSPGPFYQFRDGQFYQDDTALEPSSYVDLLRSAPCWEAAGQVEFEAAARLCESMMNDK